MEPPQLGYEETERVLAKLVGMDERIVLVGGQALNFWASYYLDSASDLRPHAPFTSKDIDFYGSIKAVKECAARLGGKARLVTMDDENTPNTGVVKFKDDGRHERFIDFLGHVAGLKEKDLEGIPAELIDGDGKPIAVFHVIDPVACLKCRAHNVARLPGYQTEHAKKQLRAAIVIAREYARDLIDQGNVKAANAVNNAVLELARYGVGIEVFVKYGFDVLEALQTDPRLPPKFFTHRLKYAVERVKAERARALAAKERGEAMAAKRLARKFPDSA